MVRLVAVAVDDIDITRSEQRLHRHFVGGRGSVGDEEHPVAAEGACRLVLRFLDIARGLEETVETAGGRAALGEEQVRAVELAHVADPVRAKHGLAARNRQRMEGADRPLGVFLEIVEERRAVAVPDAFENGEMQLEQLFHRVEDAANEFGLGVTGQLLHILIRDKIDIELGANPLQGLGQRQRRLAGVLVIHRRHQ